MVIPNQPMSPSRQPDRRLQAWLAVIHADCLVVAAFIAAVVLSAWLIPAIGSRLPDGWSLMKANSALGILLGILGLGLSRRPATPRRWLLIRCAAGVMILCAGAALVEHLTGRPVPLIDTLLAADAASSAPGRMSLQTAGFLTLLGMALLVPEERAGIRSHLADALIAGLMTLTLVVFAGYWFGAAGLFGQTPYTRTSPQTLTCMVLLAFVAIGRRADHGFFSVLIGIGIGSRIARIVLPFCLLLPFALAAVGSGVTALGWLSTTYAAALTATISSVAFSGLVLLMAWRINGLEHDLREMSLTDPLTGVYNRRGFDLLGEQALRDARRSSTPLTVLFFDVDELKSVNDRFGHEVGSQFLQDMARLLRQTFREADIVARIGGDEFAVIMHGEAANAVARVDAAAILLNREHGRRFPIGYSVGVATAAPDDEGSLDRLAGRADAMMYEQKRAKKSARAVG